MNESLAYFQGRYAPRSEIAIGLSDAGFVWGATVTDRCRTFGHRLFRWDDHVKRFRRSCALAEVPLPVSNTELTEIANRLVEANTSLLALDHDLTLILFATPGELDASPRQPTLGLYTTPLDYARYTPLFTRGATLHVPSVRSMDYDTIPPAIKHRSRLHWWLAESEVKAHDPEAQALLLDRQGLVTETATANILIVRDGVVHTPSRSRVLPGVSLQVTEEICKALAIRFSESDLGIESCQTADEIILTSTPYGVVRVGRFESMQLPAAGPVYTLLRQRWNQLAGFDIAAQFARYAPG